MGRSVRSMCRNQKTKKSKLPLINLIKHDSNRFFDPDNPQRDTSPFELPAYVQANLKHHLRPYQRQALLHLAWTLMQPNHNQYRQLLFNMATGSGKTDVMAAIILYLYADYGYQNFLFVANTNAVVAKTIDNLLNSAAEKYLYEPNITINGEHVEIRSVQQYPVHPEAGVIYLRLTTIQSLGNDLSNPRENGLTYESLSYQPLLILADEAHHFSAQTKSKAEQLNRSWENVLDRVRQSNPANRQLEFTATIDLLNESVYQKYRDKVVYQYDLSQFIKEGYAKRVYRLQANNDDSTKMLNAVLLSQYRKRLAHALGIQEFKPVILFKANKIAISKQTRDSFLTQIAALNVQDLGRFIRQQQLTSVSQALKSAYEYWLSQDLATAVVELKRDFQPLNTINVNDSPREGFLGDQNDLHNLNTLESPDNPFRAIFAVAKLSEGWDVLNLYDIVRIGEQPTTLNQTTSEAQLIGRGARYNPFRYQSKISYTRRFDNQKPDRQLLESLYYHTINEPTYLDNLKKSFDKMDLPVEDDSDFDVFATKVKPGFKQTKVYRKGQLYYNIVEDVPDESFTSLARYGIDTTTISEVNLVNSTQETDYNAGANHSDALTETRPVLNFKTDQALVKKAIARNHFFRFNQLTQHIPTLKTMREFCTGDQWLGGIRLFARVSRDAAPLNRTQQLHAVEQYLVYVQKQLVNNFQRQRGTNRFQAMPIAHLVHDYQKRVPRHDNKKFVSEWIQPYSMKDKPWYVYEEAIVDKLEKACIDLIGSFVERLKVNYTEIYLIRNDEQNSNFKLHDFGQHMTHYEGFMPDFILYLGAEQTIYQIYIEPKGSQLIEQDQWKEDLLTKIEPQNVKVIGECSQVRLYGVRFFIQGDTRNIEADLQHKNLLPKHNADYLG